MSSATDYLSEEPQGRTLRGWPKRIANALSIGLSLYALYWVLFIVQPQIYRGSFLLVALVLTFLLYRGQTGVRHRSDPTPGVRHRSDPGLADWALIALTIGALGWPLVDFERFVYRAAQPLTIDLLLGIATTALVLEATRRTVGWILPVTAVAFLLYGWAGPLFDDLGLALFAHRGYGPDRLVGTLYMTLEGIFGVPLDVAATYIILFTIYGAVLEQSGAGSFFIHWAMAVMGRSRSPAAPGRSVTVAGFLLGTVSGSGVATTVMLGSVAWPLLRRAGYPAEHAGAVLSAAGIGALLSPPTLGAAAFLIAEFLRISYLQVLVMATIPTLLYYLSIFLMIELDARRARASDPVRQHFADIQDLTPWQLTRRYGYHFTSLVAIAAFMMLGMSAFRAVFWSTMLAIAVSYLRPETALTPKRLLAALGGGARSVLGVAATTATAGIIVGVVTLTGLGLKIAGIIVALAVGKLFLTVLYSALAVWMLGLAVPVTASYIIAAVMVAPALVQSGVPDVAAHMFIFYYAVLSEVSPPTALSPFAAAALTGGNPFRTMLLTWKYTLPAFVVPFVFTLSPQGLGVLLRAPVADVVLATATAALGVAALAAALSGWILGPLSLPARIALAAGGSLLFYANPWADLFGLASTAVVLFLHLMGRSRKPRPDSVA
jgi:TRAP transporter 4TM/12TM fusion protein